MENMEYRNLLIDEDIWENTMRDTRIHFSSYYKYIYIASHALTSSRFTNPFAPILVWDEVKQDTLLAMHMKGFFDELDLDQWLYVSHNLFHIYIMQQKYHMNCCFINAGFNDTIAIDSIHEVQKFEDIIQKVYK